MDKDEIAFNNCQIQKLRENLDSMNKAFKKLNELKAWFAKGWVKFTEVAKGKDGVLAHPYLHILAMMLPSYFPRYCY
ncbi:protein rep [Nostoc sp. XA010]|uniref:protein rep n=1 Tax=Nostoc sp. XA010 TaxID=2780407 RepID=UPI002270879D|nr:protein rep [Nostoc sp. XA010]MCC5658943.1 protein rep [Nostoc sp. XA010]